MIYELSLMFFLILIEYACFPVSSELVLPLSGAFAKNAEIPFLLTLFLSSLAGVIGVSITYALGRYGGSPLLERLMNRFKRTRKPILASYRFFGDHGRLAVCLGRLVPICRTYISFIAGASGEAFSGYLLFSALGITLWNGVLLSIGYYFMQYKDRIFYYFDRYKLFILFAGGTLLILFLLRHFTREKGAEDPHKSE